MAGLIDLYPEAECELSFVDPFQLLVATILSAQTTDVAVNKITPALFARYPTPDALAAADPSDVEPLIASIGLFRNKAKSIVGAARRIVGDFGGKVPDDRAGLESLPGCGRKTANVVLSTAFGKAAMAVDTHVQRLAGRLGLSKAEGARKIEDDLLDLFPEERWAFISHALIWHGRRVCSARSPRCGECGLATDCPAAFSATKVRNPSARRRSYGASPRKSR